MRLSQQPLNLKNFLDSVNIEGVEKLKLDVDVTKPELTLTIDRERALREGLSTATDRHANCVRHYLVAKQASSKKVKMNTKFRSGILIVLRNNLTDLQNMKITYRI